MDKKVVEKLQSIICLKIIMYKNSFSKKKNNTNNHITIIISIIIVITIINYFGYPDKKWSADNKIFEKLQSIICLKIIMHKIFFFK